MADLAEFGRADQISADQVGPARSESGGATDPENQLQIAQAARTLLAIGFEAVVGVLKARMALAHLEELPGEKQCRIEFVLKPLAKLLETFAPAGEQSPLDQAGLNRDVAARLIKALINASDAVSNL